MGYIFTIHFGISAYEQCNMSVLFRAEKASRWRAHRYVASQAVFSGHLVICGVIKAIHVVTYVEVFVCQKYSYELNASPDGRRSKRLEHGRRHTRPGHSSTV